MSRAASENRNFPVTEVWVCDYLQVSRSTVQKWRQQGKGPPYVKLGKSVRYKPDEVEMWFDTQRRRGPKVLPWSGQRDSNP